MIRPTDTMADTANLSWNNSADLKATAIAAFEGHIAQDELVRGKYFSETEGGEFRGCHIGCLIHDLGGDKSALVTPEAARVSGQPEWLISLSEYFFESLPAPRNQEVSLAILNAIPVGVDLTPVYHKFLIWLLSDETHGVRQFCDDAGKAATDTVVDLHKRSASGDFPTNDEWDAARHAAGVAGWDAARAAARAAARDAGWAARAAALPAGWAGWATQAEKLISLLTESAA